MDLALQARFAGVWARSFPGAELPVTFEFTDAPRRADAVEPSRGWRCVIGQLARVRAGQALSFDAAALGCGGGKTYLGFGDALRPSFDHFLSCGIPGELEGERYKRDPETVRELRRRQPDFAAPASRIVFKRWDLLDEADQPTTAIFFATPDVLSGLFTWAGFEESDVEHVIAPFAAGCAQIVKYPALELARERPRAVLGLFDVSARPYVPAGTLSFAVPMATLARMAALADETFLGTRAWEKVRRRIAGEG